HRREGDVLEALRQALRSRPDVGDVGPGRPLIVGDGDQGMAAAVGPADVDGAVSGHRDGGVRLAGDAARNDVHRPGGAGVPGDRHPLLAVAVAVGYIGGAVRRDLDVAVDAAALRQGVHRHRRPEGEAAGETDRATGVGDVLRAVVDGVRIAGQRAQQAVRGERTAADRLVVDAGVDAGALARRPARAVVVAER